jgi:hypothetical protein
MGGLLLDQFSGSQATFGTTFGVTGAYCETIRKSTVLMFMTFKKIFIS